jgi:hypothetical protein
MRTTLPISSRRRRLLHAGVSAALLVAASAAVAASNGIFIPQLGVTVPSTKATAVGHALPAGGPESSTRAAAPRTVADRIPPHILAPDVPVPIPAALLQESNAWLVSDGSHLVAVYAGAATADPATGRFVIVRQDLTAGQQTQDVVNAAGTGSVTITAAPTAAAQESTAQRGNLVFQGRSGAQGTLALATDTVLVRP